MTDTWPVQLVALVEAATGRPLVEVGWRELARVRDAVDALLNAEVNRRQQPPGRGDAA